MRQVVFALALGVATAVSLSASAQTVRFTTSVGSFDMLLNPTNNPNLRPLVDNMLANVAAGVYHYNPINRAAPGFVLQLGSFKATSNQFNAIPTQGFAATDAFDPIVVDADNNGRVDFDTTGLTNTRGTVSLALGGGDLNTGSASFFVNVADNQPLDDRGFVPFARIADMATVDRIMALTNVDVSASVGQQGSLAYIDVPLTAEGDLVVVEGASVISPSNISFKGPVLDALNITPPRNSVVRPTIPTASSLNLSPTSGGLSGATSAATAAAVPEPAGVLLAALAIGLACFAIRR